MVVFLLMAILVLNGLGTSVGGIRGIDEQGTIDGVIYPHNQQQIHRYPRSPDGEQKTAQSEPANSEPDSKPEHQSYAEPEVTSEPVPESEFPNSSAATRPETSAEEAVPETWPEAGPRWREAFKIWNWYWELHVYLFATLYLLIGLYAGYYVFVNVHDGLMGKYLSVSLNVMVLIFGFTRAFVLYIDPYHQGGHIEAVLFMRVLWSIGGPCLMAADSGIILALVELAQVSIAPPRLQKLKTVSIIVGGHFAFVILTDWIVSIYMDAKAMLLFCQVFYVVWGSLLGTGYIRLAIVLDKKLFLHKEKSKADKVYLALIYLSGAANYFLCGIVFYSAFSVFGVYSNVDFVDAWAWWILQTLFRVSEVITCVLIFTVSAKRSRVADSDTQDANPIAPTSKPAWLESKEKCTKTACVEGSLVKETTQSCRRMPRFIISLTNYVRKYCESRVLPIPNNVIRESNWAMNDCNKTVTEIDKNCESLAVGDYMDNAFHINGKTNAERRGPSSRRRMSMFSALHDHTNTQIKMEWKEKNCGETQKEKKLEDTPVKAIKMEWKEKNCGETLKEKKLEDTPVKAFVVPDRISQKDEAFQDEIIVSGPRRTIIFSALHESIAKQQRDVGHVTEVMPNMVPSALVRDPNDVHEGNVGQIQVENDLKTISQINKAFESLDEIDEDIVDMTGLQEFNSTRRNSLFSALQDAKVETSQ